MRVETAADLAELRHVDEVEGVLEIRGEDLEGELALPELTHVDALVVEHSGLSRVSLPALRSAGSVRILDNEQLEAVDLPGLEEVAEDLFVGAQPQLTELSLGRLRWVQTLDVCGGLAALDLPMLRRVAVLVCDSPEARLDELVLPRLEYAETLLLYNMVATRRLALPALTQVSGAAAIGGARLSRIELPALRVVQQLSGFAPKAVDGWDLPALQEASALLLQSEGPMRAGLDSLQQVGELMLSAGDGADEPSQLTAPRLARAGRIALWGEFEHASFPSLRETGSLVATVRGSVDLPELASAGSLQLGFTGETQVAAAQLRTAGEIDVLTRLAPCDVSAIFPALRDAGRVVRLRADLCL